jgi:hypothetical protein
VSAGWLGEVVLHCEDEEQVIWSALAEDGGFGGV